MDFLRSSPDVRIESSKPKGDNSMELSEVLKLFNEADLEIRALVLQILRGSKPLPESLE